MGKPQTLLEGLCEHAVSLGAEFLDVERKDGEEWVFAGKGGGAFGIAHYKSNGKDALELRTNLHAAKKKTLRTILGSGVYLLKVKVYDSFGDQAFHVDIQPAPTLDSSAAPSFTAKQGQYLAYIHNFTKMHRKAPSEADLQGYFQVTPPSVHEMIKTLQRNGLIERTAGQARSIRILVSPEHLPRLE